MKAELTIGEKIALMKRHGFRWCVNDVCDYVPPVLIDRIELNDDRMTVYFEQRSEMLRLSTGIGVNSIECSPGCKSGSDYIVVHCEKIEDKWVE